ncbi:MAG: hypothetical protein FWH15_07950 [Betaproteobacteria bacterium]|nr:hypothetical protein [Betaproteobacteria bacterium]
MTSITVSFDARELMAIAENALTDRQVVDAMKKTFRRAGGWIKRRVVSELANAGIPKESLAKRVVVDVTAAGDGRVWLGMNPIPAHVLGIPDQNSYGAYVSGNGVTFVFPGAFVMHRRGRRIFERVTSRRYPIALVKYEWDGIGRQIFTANAEKITGRIVPFLKSELEKEMFKTLKGR